MKTKIIGIFALLIGALAFVDAVRPGGVNILGCHAKPFLFPLFAIGFGWLELHGREKPFRWHGHHSHWLAIVALAVVVLALCLALRK